MQTYPTIERQIGRRIRRLRLTHDPPRSQEWLAQVMLLDRPTISEIEAGRRRLRASDVPLVATALEATHADVIGDLDWHERHTELRTDPRAHNDHDASTDPK